METEVRVNVEREKVSQRNQNMGKEVLLIFMHIIMMQELLSILQKIDWCSSCCEELKHLWIKYVRLKTVVWNTEAQMCGNSKSCFIEFNSRGGLSCIMYQIHVYLKFCEPLSQQRSFSSQNSWRSKGHSV